MDLLLIRHGETSWNQQERCQGTSDVPLSERGRTQARLLREHLAGERFDRVWASDLSRALETASIVGALPSDTIVTDPGLREMDQGELEGLAWRDLLRSHGALLARWMSEPAEVEIPGGESLAECAGRVSACLARIRRQAAGLRVLVVSHNLAIAAALCQLLGEPLANFRRFRQEPCAINRLDWSEKAPKLTRCNDYSFLPRELQTVRYGPHADAREG